MTTHHHTVRATIVRCGSKAHACESQDNFLRLGDSHSNYPQYMRPAVSIKQKYNAIGGMHSHGAIHRAALQPEREDGVPRVPAVGLRLAIP